MIWIICIAAFIIVAVGTYFENLIFSVVSFVGFTVFLNYLSDFKLAAALAAHVSLIIPLIIAFLAIGVAYTLLWRWPSYIRECAPAISDKFEQAYKERTPENFDKFLNSRDYIYWFGPGNNKERLATWVFFWPFAMLTELSYKPFRFVWELIYNNIVKALVTIGNIIAKRSYNFKD